LREFSELISSCFGDFGLWQTMLLVRLPQSVWQTSRILQKREHCPRLPHFADCGGANCGTGACLSASVASLPFRGVSNCGRHLGEYAGNHHPPCRTTKIRQGRPINLRAFTRAAGISLRKSNNLSWALRVGFSAMRTTLIARSTPPSARDLGTFAA
jgi:hypothetical protein